MPRLHVTQKNRKPETGKAKKAQSDVLTALLRIMVDMTEEKVSFVALKKGDRSSRSRRVEGQKDEATTYEVCVDLDGKKHSNQCDTFFRPRIASSL